MFRSVHLASDVCSCPTVGLRRRSCVGLTHSSFNFIFRQVICRFILEFGSPSLPLGSYSVTVKSRQTLPLYSATSRVTSSQGVRGTLCFWVPPSRLGSGGWGRLPVVRTSGQPGRENVRVVVQHRRRSHLEGLRSVSHRPPLVRRGCTQVVESPRRGHGWGRGVPVTSGGPYRSYHGRHVLGVLRRGLFVGTGLLVRAPGTAAPGVSVLPVGLPGSRKRRSSSVRPLW